MKEVALSFRVDVTIEGMTTGYTVGANITDVQAIPSAFSGEDLKRYLNEIGKAVVKVMSK